MGLCNLFHSFIYLISHCNPKHVAEMVSCLSKFTFSSSSWDTALWHFPASLAVSCSHVTEFWPKGGEGKWTGPFPGRGFEEAVLCTLFFRPPAGCRRQWDPRKAESQGDRVSVYESMQENTAHIPPGRQGFMSKKQTSILVETLCVLESFCYHNQTHFNRAGIFTFNVQKGKLRPTGERNWLVNDFLDLTPKAQAIKAKINK